MRSMMMYPFVPKSTASLRPGQFWAVPLADGRFAGGRVAQLGFSTIPTPSRAFFGGLQDWIGPAEPSGGDIAGAAILAWGVLHIRAITRLGGRVLGERDLALDGIAPPRQLSATGGTGTQLLVGAEPSRLATPSEWGTLPVLSFWGYNFTQSLAERTLVRPHPGAA
jgi:hypothetical protein